jgi:hypothetical protein
MAINQLSTANTFEQWLIATQSLIAFANSLTDAAPGSTFTANTTLYVITGNLTVGNTMTAPTVNTDVIIFDDGTRLTSNVPIVNAYNHANGAFDKANSANVLAQAAYNAANTIALNGELSGNNATISKTVTANAIVANVSMTTANITVTSNITTSNIVASNDVTVTKNVSAGNVIVTNSISGNNITATNNVSAGNINTTNTVSAANISVSDTITVTKNVSTGNISVVNTVTTDNVTANLVTAIDVNTTSDVTLKYNLQQIENPIDILEKLTGFQFNWKSDGLKSYGLSAQDVEKVLPEIVRTREDGFKGINYLNLIAFLVEAVKELKKEIAEVKTGINKE